MLLLLLRQNPRGRPAKAPISEVEVGRAQSSPSVGLSRLRNQRGSLGPGEGGSCGGRYVLGLRAAVCD